MYSTTMALCPVCVEKVHARIVERDGKVFLEKYCPAHGSSTALICSDDAWYRDSLQYVKPGQRPLARSVETFQGCPESCGLCPEHQQHCCMPVIEATHRCDMTCPVCLKRLDASYQMSVEEFDACLAQLQHCEGEIGVINVSGGEPTLHPQFEDLLKKAGERNVLQTTVSTNGLRLLADPALRRVFKENDVLAALQFDGFRPETYVRLRGQDFSRQKLELIELLEKEGIKYSLVATVLGGVNESEITALVDFFFKSRAHSLMFQPVVFTGRGSRLYSPDSRITIPDVIREVERSNFVGRGDFNPLPCSHYSCFALAYYFMLGGGRVLSLKEFLGKEDYLKVIANRTLPGLDRESYGLIKEKIYEFWSAADSSASQEKILAKVRSILKELSASDFSAKRAFNLGADTMKAIYIHQFMDVHTFDFGRAIKCCNHYPHANGRLVPMCVENVLRSAPACPKKARRCSLSPSGDRFQ